MDNVSNGVVMYLGNDVVRHHLHHSWVKAEAIEELLQIMADTTVGKGEHRWKTTNGKAFNKLTQPKMIPTLDFLTWQDERTMKDCGYHNQHTMKAAVDRDDMAEEVDSSHTTPTLPSLSPKARSRDLCQQGERHP